MNIASKIAKESTITLSGMIYGSINRYIYIALLARWVGVEYLGVYSLANAIMLIGEAIAKNGFRNRSYAIYQSIRAYKQKNHKFKELSNQH